MTETETDSAATRKSFSTEIEAGLFLPWLGRGWSITKRHLLWVLIPLVTGLLSVVPVVRALGHGGVSVNPTATFPAPVVDLWPLVGIRVNELAAIGSESAAVLLSLPALVTVLSAGMYLGSLHDLLAHRRPSLWRSLVEYGLPIGLYVLVWEGGLGLAFALSAVSLPLGAAVFLAFTLAAYRLWTAPFLAVVESRSLLGALRRAWRVSSGSGTYRQFSVSFLATTLLLSLPRVYGVLAARPAVLVASVVVLAPLAMVLTVAALAFVRSFVGEGEKPEATETE